MTNRKRIWIIIAVVTVVTPVLIFFTYSLVWDRLELVEKGLASPEFPYTKYSQQELEEIYPSHGGNDNIATTRTPEETHKIFVDKLKDGDLDGAVECCFLEEDWEYMKKGLIKVKNDNYLDLMISEVSIIQQEMMLDTIATYTYISEVDGKKFSNIIEFIKNNEGIWLMESL